MKKYTWLLASVLLVGCSEQAETPPPVQVEKQEAVETEETPVSPTREQDEKESISEERAEALKLRELGIDDAIPSKIIEDNPHKRIILWSVDGQEIYKSIALLQKNHVKFVHLTKDGLLYDGPLE